MKSTSHAIKAVAPFTLKGRGVVYGGEDLTGDRFSKDTDFGGSRPFVGMPVYYDHALGGIKSQIGVVKVWTPSDEGIDVQIELDRRHKYAADVMKLAESGALGLSTGALPHLVERVDGEIKRWVVGEISLTPTPAEPRTTTEVSTKGTTVRTAAANTGHDDIKTAVSTEETQNTMDNIKDAVKAAINELAGEPVQGGTIHAAPAIKAAPAAVEVTSPFDTNEYHQAYKSFMRGSDDASVMNTLTNAKKAAFKTMTEATNNDGGFTVPTTVNREIVAKRDEMSLLGQFGFTRVTTESWKHIMPSQSTKATPGIVAEGVTATASEPNLANSKTIQLYKDTLEFALSDELLADTSSNLESFIQTEIARAMAVSSNNYIINGSGSSQPYGLLTRVTNTTAFSASAITNAQIIALSTDVAGEYLTNGEAGFIMQNSTWGALKTLDLTNYNRITSTDNGVRRVEGWPVALSAQIPAIGTGNKSIIFGNFAYYAFCERASGVQIERWRDIRKGLTYVVASWRYGGDVTQIEAFALGVHA
ncbi:COG4653 Predicted phage phi-C31 gp36 major capsid-like protein [uncultured Caudovirales phage]|uniref:COG4653 Predicted phage phi-C31 gp36 major capsid-like protein n=1 Tax=uncultured Caudovirales phage TaxID=2100421 RepID=A0A6J5NIY8_9CAUD|nr:COG4653 Predicted phage phi-C31 gp36 major capsid-like protein [uncultured Caudovirales phage]